MVPERRFFKKVGIVFFFSSFASLLFFRFRCIMFRKRFRPNRKQEHEEDEAVSASLDSGDPSEGLFFQ